MSCSGYLISNVYRKEVESVTERQGSGVIVRHGRIHSKLLNIGVDARDGEFRLISTISTFQES
jgi:hypothetical protein